jgi:hypothetical protein
VLKVLTTAKPNNFGILAVAGHSRRKNLLIVIIRPFVMKR